MESLRSRLLRLAMVLSTGLLTGAGAAAATAAVAPTEARADEAEDDLRIGTELVATCDVSLHRARIDEGSKVTVTKRTLYRGRLTSVDLELGDGHVVPRVGIAKVRDVFRVTEQPS